GCAPGTCRCKYSKLDLMSEASKSAAAQVIPAPRRKHAFNRRWRWIAMLLLSRSDRHTETKGVPCGSCNRARCCYRAIDCIRTDSRVCAGWEAGGWMGDLFD